uniref:Pumilio domain-containing protein NOP9 n=1 Tax=Pseudo-nitzschia australis TaxID=44445 RepID=A0A7S4ASM3_9STRA|mmetsp:Transcript_26954/g.56456  ORF Transcript_26954/g.56456 Transcript_26954/m.56456 type:complete len:829 (-) Transcript_26954:291-2777(-)
MEEGYHRPRRPASETIAYLRGLPLDIDSAHQEVARFLSKNSSGGDAAVATNEADGGENDDDDDDDFFPQSLAAAFSALEEVKSEIASLAGDEYGSQSIEILARIAAPYSELAARILLNACKGYYLHLATHRYGSHVLQTILQLSAATSATTAGYEAKDLALHEESPPSLQEEGDDGSLPSLYDCIQAIVEEILPHAADLTVHLCGSHVLRTLLCVLGGVSLEAGHARGNNNKRFDQTGGAIRGRLKPKKKKKKKPKPGSSSTDDAAPHAGTMTVVYQTNSRVDSKEFASTLESLSKALLGEPSEDPGELQQHACHTSAGPLLIVLVRVLTYSTDEARNEFSVFPSNSGNNNNNLNPDAAKKNANNSIADFRMGIAKTEPRYAEGSLAEEAVKQILCWQEGADQQEHVSDVVYGLSGEPRGSHVLETILRLCPDDFYESLLKHGDFLSAQTMQDYAAHPVSNFVVQTMLTTVRSKEQAETVLKTTEKVIASGVAIDPTKRRRGILWRATELASKYRIEQDGLLKAVRLGFLAVHGDGNNNSNPETTTDNSEGGKKKKQRKKASSVELKDCIPMLIGLKRNPEDDQHITLDAAGCRSVHHMLRFSPRLCQDVLDGIIEEMSAEDLVSIAKDGLGSRCIMDGILDGPVKTTIFGTATKDLREKLIGCWASLATDRVGHHTVKKVFKSLPRIDDKAKLVEELVDGGNRLRGNTMGRSVIDSCLVDAYEENRKEWRHKVGKLLSTSEEKFLAEVMHIPEHKNNNNTPTTASTSAVEGEEEPNDGTITTKAKRKRRRKRKNNDSAEGHDDDSRKVPKTSASISTESIMNIMNVN